jgi:hypothetical protein
MVKAKGKRKKSKQRKGCTTAPHVYRMPRTAAQLGIACTQTVNGSPCGQPVSYYDPDYLTDRGDFRTGLICEMHPRSPRAQKLLISPEITEAPDQRIDGRAAIGASVT